MVFLTAEQDFYLSAIAPSKPKEKSDLLYLIQEDLPNITIPELLDIANSCTVALLQMSDEEYTNLTLSETFS